MTDFSASVEVGRVCKMAVEQRVELSGDVVESLSTMWSLAWSL